VLKIRLQRTGRKHEPTFRVVLTDSKNSTKSGRYVEVLGSYDPRKTTEKFEGEKIKEWISKGAKLSPTVHNLLISHNIIEGKKINVLPKKSPPVKEQTTDNTQPTTSNQPPTTKNQQQATNNQQPTIDSEAPKVEIESEVMTIPEPDLEVKAGVEITPVEQTPEESPAPENSSKA